MFTPFYVLRRVLPIVTVLVVAHPASAAIPAPRTLFVGNYPFAAVVDQRDHHAFVFDRPANTVAVLDTLARRVIRVLTLPAGALAGAACEQTGRIFSTDADGSVAMLDARSGKVLHTTRIGDYLPALAADNATRRVFVANFNHGAVIALDARSGNRLHAVSVGGSPVDIAVDEAGGHAFVANKGYVSVLDARSGRLLRTVPVGMFARHIAVDSRTHRVFIAGDVSGGPPGAPAVGGLWVLDSRTFVTVTRQRIGGYPQAIGVDSPTGRVFIDSQAARTVTTVDARSGAVTHTTRLGLIPGIFAIDPRVGRVFVPVTASRAGGYRGYVDVLSAGDGHWLFRVPAGVAPSMVVLDAGSGTVLALNTNMTRGRGGSVTVFSAGS